MSSRGDRYAAHEVRQSRKLSKGHRYAVFSVASETTTRLIGNNKDQDHTVESRQVLLS